MIRVRNVFLKNEYHADLGVKIIQYSHITTAGAGNMYRPYHVYYSLVVYISSTLLYFTTLPVMLFITLIE